MWFDLANAYGSDHHKLTESAMELYHIPKKVQEIVERCYGGIQILLMSFHQSRTKSLERAGHRMYNLPYPVCNGYVNVGQDCRKRNKRAKDGLRDLSTPIGGLTDNITVTSTANTQAG